MNYAIIFCYYSTKLCRWNIVALLIKYCSLIIFFIIIAKMNVTQQFLCDTLYLIYYLKVPSVSLKMSYARLEFYFYKAVSTRTMAMHLPQLNKDIQNNVQTF